MAYSGYVELSLAWNDDFVKANDTPYNTLARARGTFYLFVECVRLEKTAAFYARNMPEEFCAHLSYNRFLDRVRNRLDEENSFFFRHPCRHFSEKEKAGEVAKRLRSVFQLLLKLTLRNSPFQKQYEQAENYFLQLAK